MNKRKFFFVAGLMFAMAAISATASFAQENPGRMRPRARIAMLQEFVRGLNITADQRAQIKTIVRSHKTQIQQAARDVVKARLDMQNGVSGAPTELATALTQAANLKKQIFEEIKPVLTPDQLAKAQQLQDLKMQRLERQLDRLNSKIGG
jgi:Spy/CpxP family protein refolding chaperone